MMFEVFLPKQLKTISGAHVLAFRRFFAGKLLFSRWIEGRLEFWPMMLFALGSLLTCTRRHFRPGLAIQFMGMLFLCWEMYPFTLNHFTLETLLLGILLIFSPPGLESGREEEQVDGTAAQLIGLAILSLWFYAGFQKVLHGQYLDGEMFVFEAFFNESSQFGELLRQALIFVEPIVGPVGIRAHAFGWSGSPGVHSFPLPPAASGVLLSLSWMVVLGEIAFPLLAFFSKTHRVGIAGMILLQMAIAVFSAEFDFGFTGLACVFLFCSQQGPRIYAWTFSAVVVFAAWHMGWLG